MHVLVVGSGSREHALAWKLRQSPGLTSLLTAPGNAGTAALGENVPVAATDVEGLLRLAQERRVDLTVVGPEGPLAAGIVDRFREAGLAIFGPTQAAARLESSKAFAKQVMRRHGVPCADGLAFDSYREAEAFVRRRGAPLVVKADGLAAGKGVVVAGTLDEALGALRAAMLEHAFGAAGERVVIEEALAGREVSVFALTDGTAFSPLVAACDYKRVFDGDRGPNTGGMGAYSPPDVWDDGLAATVRDGIIAPVIRGMAAEGCPVTGVLYAGLMLTAEGPKVLEFNCRWGDPEAQVVLPRLQSDLLEVCLAVAQGRLGDLALAWDPRACVGVVLAAPGYPGDYPRGLPIRGLDVVLADVMVFHGGTRDAEGQVVTDGGRVLTVAALGETLEAARQRAYQGAEGITFEGVHYRRDIALLGQKAAR